MDNEKLDSMKQKRGPRKEVRFFPSRGFFLLDFYLF